MEELLEDFEKGIVNKEGEVRSEDRKEEEEEVKKQKRKEEDEGSKKGKEKRKYIKSEKQKKKEEEKKRLKDMVKKKQGRPVGSELDRKKQESSEEYSIIMTDLVRSYLLHEQTTEEFAQNVVGFTMALPHYDN